MGSTNKRTIRGDGVRELAGREQQLAAQLEACRSVLEETLYCNRQLHTVIQMKEIELAEMENQLAHVRQKLRRNLYPAHLFGEVEL